jgi:hypothetical protein
MFFTSKDTLHKFPVSDKVGNLTAYAGANHVDRYEKARQMKEEAERKMYGKKKPTTNSQRSTHLYSTQVKNIITTNTNSNYSNTNSTQDSTGMVIDDLAMGTPAVNGADGGGMDGSGPFTYADLHNNNSNQDVRAADVEAALAREFSVVEVLERERREWAAERIKLVQCIHLQQMELAARASAAQETAATIAKEFASTIEVYEERLLNVEAMVMMEMKDMKALLNSRLPAAP